MWILNKYDCLICRRQAHRNTSILNNIIDYTFRCTGRVHTYIPHCNGATNSYWKILAGTSSHTLRDILKYASFFSVQAFQRNAGETGELRHEKGKRNDKKVSQSILSRRSGILPCIHFHSSFRHSGWREQTPVIEVQGKNLILTARLTLSQVIVCMHVTSAPKLVPKKRFILNQWSNPDEK